MPWGKSDPFPHITLSSFLSSPFWTIHVAIVLISSCDFHSLPSSVFLSAFDGSSVSWLQGSKQWSKLHSFLFWVVCMSLLSLIPYISRSHSSETMVSWASCSLSGHEQLLDSAFDGFSDNQSDLWNYILKALRCLDPHCFARKGIKGKKEDVG